MTKLDHIHIFATDIKGFRHGCELPQIFDTHAGISEWSLDAEDVDCVLRVVSPSLTPKQIVQIVRQHGYNCHELP